MIAFLHVREILLASATVRPLSLAELSARGITLTAENFQAFNFEGRKDIALMLALTEYLAG